eukprot:7377249-Ditylum_brightwellii.AAC.1
MCAAEQRSLPFVHMWIKLLDAGKSYIRNRCNIEQIYIRFLKFQLGVAPFKDRCLLPALMLCPATSYD